MKKHLFLRAVCALVVPAAMSAGCSDNNEPYGGSEPDNEKADGKYVIAASVTDSKYCLPPNRLTKDRFL